MKSIFNMVNEALLSERFVNLLPSDVAEKEKYADDVWDMITKSYAAIGGIKGKGFSTKQEMIKDIAMWKIVKRNSKAVAVSLYKDKDGRKRVAVATDGSEEGKKAIREIFKEDFDRSYGEVSDAALGTILSIVGQDFFEKYAKLPDQVQKILKDDEILPADLNDPSIQRIIGKYPKVAKFYYQREIGGKLKHKVLIGTHGKVIFDYQV